MVTPLKKTALHELISKPVLFDANIFMVGISERISDERYSFENMKQLYIIPLFESFTNIYIHEEVYKELDDESRSFVDTYKGKNVSIVGEDGLYGKDPQYTILFNNIATHELVKYKRGESKNRGEVYSLAYAAYHNIREAGISTIPASLMLCNPEIISDIVFVPILPSQVILSCPPDSHKRRHRESRYLRYLCGYSRSKPF